MDENDRNTIRTRLQSLVSSVTDFESLLNCSLESGIFTKQMIADFKLPNESEHERITKYFLGVTKRGPAAFGRLKACLLRSGNWDTKNVLEANVSDLPDSAGYSSEPQQQPITERYFNGPLGKIIIKKAKDINGGNGRMSNVYKMSSKPRGYAVVFVNKDFDKDYETRVGAEEDGRIIHDLFEGLGYKIDPHFNKTIKEMKAIIKAYTCKPELEFVDSFVVAVSSHGEIDGIVCKDTEILDVDTELIDMFNNENCPLLKTKPKMFFIQACRGKESDGGIALDRRDSRAYPIPATPQKIYLPTYTDILVFHATQLGFVAFLNERHGSWFFNTIANVFMENAWRDDVQTMLNEVTRRMNQLRAGKEGEKQSGEIKFRGWEKALYFNPGL